MILRVSLIFVVFSSTICCSIKRWPVCSNAGMTRTKRKGVVIPLTYGSSDCKTYFKYKMTKTGARNSPASYPFVFFLMRRFLRSIAFNCLKLLVSVITPGP